MKFNNSSHLPADILVFSRLRSVAWLSIALQVAFPLTMAFSPMMARANEQNLLAQPSQRTEVYTLKVGDTAQSVAKKYYLTLDQLRELNQFRTFSQGLNGLRPGDDVDVPAASVNGASGTGGDNIPASAAGAEGDEQAQKVAVYTSQGGSLLASGANGEAVASMARGMATGEAGDALQQWLSHFGTARVQLDADEHFSLKNSQLDLLIPLYDQGDNLVFTQGSLHRTDSRTQANLGAGMRHFTPTWMLGGNLFGDYDLSRDHARMGVGAEYWRDFLKLGVNGYMRLTGWKDSPDLADYQERPADGWDVRMQAWLPSLPQLGGKLTYEQYYGKEVALFGVDNRQKNPRAITAGINYTPVPLITIGAEQRQGQSDASDTRLTLDMNYQLGVSWRSQVDPNTVATLRSLIGSRYDLVERNNNIVLEYRKKEILRLHTVDLITGYAGEQKSLGVSVTSTYGLSRIDWDASALNAAGGKIVQNGSDYAVVLPAYRATAQAVNTYTVSGVAVDTKGNRSERSDTQVTVQMSEVNQQTSTFTPAYSTLPADGKSTQILTLTLWDKNNQPVDTDVKEISLKYSTLKSATLSALTRKSAGVYTVTLTAGTDNEKVTLTPSVSGVTISPAEVTISNTMPDEKTSTIKTDSTTYVAGTDITVLVILKDSAGNALTGEAGLLTTSTVTVPNATLKTGSSWTDNGDGTYTATYTAETMSTDNQATLKLSGWSAGSTSEKYAITLEIEPPESINTQVNPHTFAQTSVDGTFPTTGFTGATFTIVPKDNKNATDYTWASDASWSSVADGVVTFTGTATGSKVTITGMPKNGQGKIIKYSFTLKNWFIGNGTALQNWSDANTYCSSQSGYSLPTVAQMSLNSNYVPTQSRDTGALWNEWGNTRGYSVPAFSGHTRWSSEQRSSGFHYFAALNDGYIGAHDDLEAVDYTLCRKGL
ncbi:invasin [Cedecea lapagei]|nr:invasin [Cedecea lapagei]